MTQRKFEREARKRKHAEARRVRGRAGLAAGAATAAVLMAPAIASAETFNVTSAEDDGGSGTLRTAIEQSNANSEADTITFADALRGKTIVLTEGQLSINGNNGLTITGPGAADLTITATADSEEGPQSRIFSVSGTADTAISGLTLTGGLGQPGESHIDSARSTKVVSTNDEGVGGGAIRTEGNLTLTDSIVTGNKSSDEDVDYGAGGGILVTGGETTVERTEVTKNTAQGTSASGGGIANTGGTLTVRDSPVTENSASGDSESFGGGITAIGTTTVADGSSIADNDADNGGGISGNDAATFESGMDYPCSPFPECVYKYELRVADSTKQLTVSDSTVTGNEAESGGAIGVRFGQSDDSQQKHMSDSTDAVSIVRSTIGEDNTASAKGGGVSVESQAADNAVSIRDTTISANQVQNGDGTPTGTGGAVSVDKVVGPFKIANSTLSGNSAGTGGGIFAGTDTSTSNRAAKVEVDEPPDPTGAFEIANSTIASNEAGASDGGGGVYLGTGVTDGANTQLNSSIVSDNTAAATADDVVTQPSPQQSGDALKAAANGVSPDAIDSAYSLIETPGDAVVNTDSTKPTITGQDPQLGDLTDNGGPTETQLPATTSPVIDQGSAFGLTADQRGLARTVGRTPTDADDGTDMGAVELPAEPSSAPNTPSRPTTPAKPQASRPLSPSSVPASCGRRMISLLDARVSGGKVILKGLVGSKLYGKKVTIETDLKGAKASAFSRTTTVTASKTGTFTARVAKPAEEDYTTVRYRAVAGSAKSTGLKLPQSLTSHSVKSAKGTITVTGTVKKSLLGSRRNTVTIRRLRCGHYRTVGSVKPDADGNYKVTFKASSSGDVSLYRAEAKVLVRPGSKHYVTQYARAIAIKTTSQTG